MSFANHEISHLIQVSPGKARQKLLRVLKAQGMHKSNTAKALGCTHGTLLRWIAKLNMGLEVQTLTAKAHTEEWYVSGNRGRPKGSTVANGAAPRNSVRPV